MERMERPATGADSDAVVVAGCRGGFRTQWSQLSLRGQNPDDISLHVNACARMGCLSPLIVAKLAILRQTTTPYVRGPAPNPRPKTNPSPHRPARKRIVDRDPRAAMARTDRRHPRSKTNPSRRRPSRKRDGRSGNPPVAAARWRGGGEPGAGCWRRW